MKRNTQQGKAGKLTMGPERVTLRDVARKAGVSVMTVSNVMRGKAARKETRDRVLAIVKQLNYRPNASARGLRQARVHSVGFVISHRDPAFLSDPFISNLVSGLSNLLSSIDYTLDVQGVTPERFEGATILQKDGNDALCAILCGPVNLRRQHMRHLEGLGIPVVIFQEYFKTEAPEVAIVRQDDRGGGRQLAAHIMRGRKPKNIVFLRPATGWAAVEEREEGVRSELKRAGLSDADMTPLVTESENFEAVRKAVLSYLNFTTPHIIIAATDVMGAAAIKACEDRNLKVPAQVQVTGYNGFETWQFTKPTLTTVISPAYEMGVNAGKLLIERLNTGAYSTRNLKMPVTLQIGDSA